MPYVKVVTTQKLTEDKKASITKEFGEKIALIPNKSEGIMMIAFHDATDLFFGGKRCENAGYIEINLHMEAPFSDKQALTKEVFAFMEKELGIEKKDLYVILPEHKLWGAVGDLHG